MKKKPISVLMQIIFVVSLVAVIVVTAVANGNAQQDKIEGAKVLILNGDEKEVSKLKAADKEGKEMFSKDNLTKALLNPTSEDQNIINVIEYKPKEDYNFVSLSYQRGKSGELKNAYVSLFTEDYSKIRAWSIENEKEAYLEVYVDENKDGVSGNWKKSSEEAEQIITFWEDLIKDKAKNTIQILRSFIDGGKYKVIECKDGLIAYGDVKTKTDSYKVIVELVDGNDYSASILNSDNEVKGVIGVTETEDKDYYYSPPE